MRKLREILRLKYDVRLPHRAIARACGVGAGTVSVYLARAWTAELSWPLPEGMDDAQLEGKVFGCPLPSKHPRPLPDLVGMHQELKRAGVTLQLLWVEYLHAHPHGYRYSQCCQLYRHWRKRFHPTMRQRHRAGAKVFVDYSGKKLQLVDPQTGELRPVELFVGVLGASGLIYAEASADQSLTSWVDCHRHMLEYFGGSPGVFVPDQLKNAVAAPCRYEPEVNRTYQALARHYGAVVIPARPRKPKDKAYVSYCILFGELNGDKDRRLCTPSACSLDEHDASKGFIQTPVVVAVEVSP
ncbi:MAG: IS21 family transposase [Gammaproteobacteria bacterium]